MKPRVQTPVLPKKKRKRKKSLKISHWERKKNFHIGIVINSKSLNVPGPLALAFPRYTAVTLALSATSKCGFFSPKSSF
jgi:hypothetical protein